MRSERGYYDDSYTTKFSGDVIDVGVYRDQPAVERARPVNPIVLLPLLTVLLGLLSPATILYGPADAWRHGVLDQLPLAMLFILWHGAFFPIYLSTLHGVRSTRTAHLETLRLMGAGRLHALRWAILPHALPAIANGMRIALAGVVSVAYCASTTTEPRTSISASGAIGFFMACYPFPATPSLQRRPMAPKVDSLRSAS